MSLRRLGFTTAVPYLAIVVRVEDSSILPPKVQNAG